MFSGFATFKQHQKDHQNLDKADPSLRKSLVHENYNCICFLNTKYTLKLKTLSSYVAENLAKRVEKTT